MALLPLIDIRDASRLTVGLALPQSLRGSDCRASAPPAWTFQVAPEKGDKPGGVLEGGVLWARPRSSHIMSAQKQWPGQGHVELQGAWEM